MAVNRHGAASLALLKFLPLAGAVYLGMRFAFDQAAANGDSSLWLAIAGIGPVILGVGMWMIKDSGNLRELRGRYDDFRTDTKRELEKNDDANERIFRELGAQGEFRRQVDQRLEQLQGAVDLQGKLRHDFRNEVTALVGAVELKLTERDDKQDVRLRDVERAMDRRGE